MGCDVGKGEVREILFVVLRAFGIRNATINSRWDDDLGVNVVTRRAIWAETKSDVEARGCSVGDETDEPFISAATVGESRDVIADHLSEQRERFTAIAAPTSLTAATDTSGGTALTVTGGTLQLHLVAGDSVLDLNLELASS